MSNPKTTEQLLARYNAPRLAFILLIIICSIQAHATTAIVIVGDHGIAITVDRKIVLGNARESQRRRTGETQGAKYLVIQNRIAIVDIGYEFFKIANASGTVILDYDFGTWVRGIESGLPDNVSFDQFVGVVNAEFRKMIPKWQVIVSGGGMHQKNAEDIFDLLLSTSSPDTKTESRSFP